MKRYVRFLKDGDNMAVETNHETAEEFLEGVSQGLSEMIDKKMFDGDWDFQFGYWLPQIIQIASSYPKSGIGEAPPVTKATEISCGSSGPVVLEI